MSKVVGVVEKIAEFPTARGTMYSITVNGVQYGTGSVNPKAGRGDTVAFDYRENGKYKNVDMKTFSVEAGAPATGPITVGGSSANYGDKQEIISRQSALNSSLAFIDILVKADAVPGVTKTSKADEKYGILRELVAETAEEFYQSNMNKQAPPSGSGAATEAQEKASGDKSWG